MTGDCMSGMAPEGLNVRFQRTPKAIRWKEMLAKTALDISPPSRKGNRKQSRDGKLDRACFRWCKVRSRTAHKVQKCNERPSRAKHEKCGRRFREQWTNPQN
ncbi:hypothetical protein J2X19_001051 [Rhodoferax ferrireducens]|uniref:Uncharacterized protein n=1 Tax=Rhodoferax ferrireducens TaxID=192843 RepID=A0ABU2C4Y3_9BURK|nr:hypothetical protein [Rhodoferax ferrireducens]